MRSLTLSRLVGWPAVWLLVGFSSIARTLVAFRRETPAYFPDEYMYAELGRSLADNGRPLVRGVESTFPALLQPIVTAPVWLIEDVATAYHLIQALNALAISLAAVPVYLLARRLGIDERLALAVAALSLALPALLYASWIISEPFAYPLVAWALLLGVRALERPAARAQAAFLLVAGFAGFARAQLLVLPLCLVAATIVVGVRERRLRGAVRDQWLAGGAVLLAAAGFATHGASVGLYGGLLSLDLAPASLASRLATQSLCLLYASGWVLVPAAVLGLVLAVGRPHSKGELAFGALSTSLVAALLLQASLWGDVTLMQERYTFYAVPMLVIAFALYASRGWPCRRAHALGCAALLVLAATVPLSGYVAQFGNRHSPVLFAVARLEQISGVGAGSLVVAAVAGALALITAALAISGRATGGVATLALAAAAATGVAATSYDLTRNDAIRKAYLPADPSWVDHAAVGDVALVYAPGHYKDGLEQLFWNRSVRRILLLPGAESLDAFTASRLRIARDGTLLEGGQRLRTPVLVDSRAADIRLRNARVVDSSPAYDLWTPLGEAKLASAAFGWYRDGWLAGSGSFQVWAPRITGRVRFRVAAARRGGDAELTISTGNRRLTVTVPAGTWRTIELAACARHSWRATVASDQLTFAADRVISLRATRPVWTPDPSACS